MKNLLISLCLFTVLLSFGLFVFKQTTKAQNNVVINLLDLPAPPPPNPLNEFNLKARTEEFYNKNNPPNDDAPIEDLLEYWQRQNSFDSKYTYTAKISDKNLERILAEVEKNPELLSGIINSLPEKPEVADFVKKIYDRQIADEDSEKYQIDEIKKWLTYHTDYFSDELLRAARKTSETEEYVTNQDELLALARVDWDKARPILESMITNSSQPVSQTLARWAFYQHALAENNSSDAEKYRKELQETVKNQTAKPGMRDLAMDALVESGDFEGRDDWYYSLLSDESLYDLRVGGQHYTGLTTIINHSPSDKYVAKMLELVKSSNTTIRKAAILNLTALLDEKNPEVVRALLPWLENPEWANETANQRQTLIRALANFAMPESVPGLIAVLNEKATKENYVSRMSSNMANSSVTVNSNVAVVVSSAAPVEYYPYRSAAIAALIKQKDARAVPALRSILPQVETYERSEIVRALVASNGFSVPEQIEALEIVAKTIRTPENVDILPDEITMSNRGLMSNVVVMPPTTYTGNVAVVVNSMSNKGYAPAYNPADIKSILGNQLVTTREVSDELVAGLIDRIQYLDKRDARLAFALRSIMKNWKGAAINSLLLKDLKNGKAEPDAIVKLLSLRKELREKQSNEVFDIRSGNSSVALGISACLLEDNNEYDALLAGENIEAKTVMLACARLIRASLPVRKVAENLQSPNKVLALAAERYLESEDSPEARSIVLSLHPNEAKVLGARAFFATSGNAASEGSFLADLFTSVNESLPPYLLYEDYGELETNEKRLQKEVKENQELLGVYSYDDNFVRIYKDRAVFSWEEDTARYRERVLSEAEFAGIKNYLASRKADEMKPFLLACGEEDCDSKELLMLGRQGGRRVFFKGERTPEFFTELGAMFAEMRKPPAKLHYRLEKNIVGLEILFADDNLQAKTIWKNGDDFRVLIDDAVRRKQIDKELEKQDAADEEAENYDAEKGEQIKQKRRAQREFENLAWYKVEKNTLGDATVQPAQIEYLPVRDNFPAPATNQRWKSRAANLEIRAREDDGLYKITNGQSVKIRNGYYYKAIVTPNGHWAIATKYAESSGGSTLVRVNLLTNKEFKINIEKFPRLEPVAYSASVNKVLILGGYYREDEPDNAVDTDGSYFLLDADTGLVQSVKGEIRPLAQQTFRPLQPTASPDEFWAAIPDAEKDETQIGIYNAKTFSFKSVLNVPQIKFDSMNLQVDERENKIYFVYQGHLLSLPLPRKQTK
ncbi:MAG: hypothetical protein M3033_12725 [Acidobacteriota bacterium]|nr:hypothetical protein [Acidobacteriota bacterium]